MRPEVIVDTGPLVAYVVSSERSHRWAREQMEALPGPLLTCEAVIAEATYLLRRTGPGSFTPLTMVERGAVRIAFDLASEHAAVARLMRKFRDVPMSLADACLVRMAEIRPEAEIMTLDADFLLYRTSDRRVLRTRMPDSAEERGR